MRTLSLIVGATGAFCLAAAASAHPTTDRIQLTQARDSGAQSGSGASTTQRGGTSNQESGAAATRGSEGSGGAGQGSTRQGTTVRSETQSTSRTSVREHSSGARVSVRGNRAAVGERTAASGGETVLIKRKKARHYVSSEPSVRVIRKKRYVTYRESPRAVIVKKRRPGVAVESGVSTRTTVRSRSSTTVRDSSKAGESVGTGPGSAREGSPGRSTHQSAPNGGQSGSDSPGRSGGTGTGAAPGAR
jgi:hypothetical protein